MTDSFKKILKAPLGLWKKIKIKIFILSDYLQAQIDFWIGPHGRRSTPEKRLQPIQLQADLKHPGSTSRASASGDTPERIALFIAYAKRLTHSNRSYIEALKQAGFEVVYINNEVTNPETALALEGICWRVFDRRNIGRDFGGFRDGVLLLHGEGHLERCQLLCIANDSMQFIPGRNAQALVAALKDFAAGEKQALFSHISHQIQTHYQSYFQVLKPEVFRSRTFLQFWKDYLPLSHRGHCIYNGEIALSQRVYRRFQSVDTLYTSDKLQEALETHFASQGGVPAEEVFRLMPSPARTSQRRKIGYSLQQLMQQSDQHKTLTGAQLYSVADLIENGNPSHIAAFLYPIYLHCPFVKHDLCTAGSYTMAQAISLFREAARQSLGVEDGTRIENLVDEFKDLMYIRGVPLSYDNRLREAAIKGITGAFVYPSTYE
ncbi:hypothetical protein KBZ12_15830 [Cyanobium sp. Cruz CV13-4-11]|jgi:hypothetical protein|uniref:rhamnan synthesis F family protein n=1 Tax=unclassified Cyanobium TaxID=2627006 RepID=UPI0020CD2214|nr:MULTISPECIES: rhamnan synthesis F family protein [unclassified Cyanobium]MCP9902073.1 hypothetical protein [Cyanobium sp. Cruz CV11-17]MCP9920920.1 hypothetical protein [Cyanobium sp. Cruz CV13-4-11]